MLTVGRSARRRRDRVNAPADGGRSRPDGARSQSRSERRPARSADQRHARRGGGRRCSGRRSTRASTATTSCSRRRASCIPTATRTDAVTSSAGLSQRLPWFGTSYSVSWNAVHTDSNSFLTSYNPLLTSGLSLAVSQPLMRDLSIDAVAAAAEDQPDQPRHRRHAAAREPRPHDREREERVLESRVGDRERRLADVGAEPGAGARSREQSQGGRRPVAAARPACRRRPKSPPTKNS